MAMKVNVGLSRKLGTPNYGSVCASCDVEFTLESGLQPNDLDQFQRQVRNAYTACRDAIVQELARQHEAGLPNNGEANAPISADVPGQLGPAFPATSPPNGNGSRNNGSNGHGASEKQMSYLRQLAKQVPGLGIRRLEALTKKLYGKPVAVLTSFEASGVIDTLKAAKSGDVDINQVLDGAPA
jgi:hypothetical protein